AETERSAAPEAEAEAEPTPDHAPHEMVIEQMHSHASELASALEPEAPSLVDDFGDLSLDVERSPSLEMDAIVPDGGLPLPLLELDETESVTFDREHALSGLPMLDADTPPAA